MEKAPQFSIDALYIPRATAVRRYDAEGVAHYEALTHSDKPTGVEVLDALARTLSTGRGHEVVLAQFGISAKDLGAVCRVMLGMQLNEVEREVRFRLADDLLRYTNLQLGEVARRAGMHTCTQLCKMYRRRVKCSPTEYRKRIRKERDVGRYKFS